MTGPYFSTDSLASIVFWSVCLIWFIPEFVGAFIQRSDSNARKRDRGSALVLYVLITVGITLAFNTAPLQKFAITDAHEASFWSGIALIVCGTLLRWYSIRILGKFFTRDVAVSPAQTVIQTGPYRYIRHPSYTGGLISFLGLGFALGNWASLAAVMGFAIPGYIYRVRVEERALVEALGQPYIAYMQHTRRFIPFLV